MFAQSAVYAQLSSGAFGKYIIIGDSGYGNTHFLCTPFSRRERPNPQAYSEADKEYQRAILTTRNTIERAFGVLTVSYFAQWNATSTFAAHSKNYLSVLSAP